MGSLRFELIGPLQKSQPLPVRQLSSWIESGLLSRLYLASSRDAKRMTKDVEQVLVERQRA